MLKRGLREVGGGSQQVRLRATDNRVRTGHQLHAVAARIGGVERAVDHVGTKGFLGLNQRLGEVTRIGLANPNVVAVFHQHFGQGESQTVDAVDVTLDEQHAT